MTQPSMMDCLESVWPALTGTLALMRSSQALGDRPTPSHTGSFRVCLQIPALHVRMYVCMVYVHLFECLRADVHVQ